MTQAAGKTAGEWLSQARTCEAKAYRAQDVGCYFIWAALGAFAAAAVTFSSGLWLVEFGLLAAVPFGKIAFGLFGGGIGCTTVAHGVFFKKEERLKRESGDCQSKSFEAKRLLEAALKDPAQEPPFQSAPQAAENFTVAVGKDAPVRGKLTLRKTAQEKRR